MAWFSRLLADIPGIRHAFLDVHESAVFDKSRLVDIKQVHGANILHLTETPAQRPQVDGVLTSLTGKSIGIVTADCIPVLMASRDGRWIAGLHAGWRGAAQGILQESVRRFSAHGVAAEDILVATGPHIRACCYEVSGAFRQTLLETPAGYLVRDYAEQLFSSWPKTPNPNSPAAREENSLWFDLLAFCQLQLLDAGISRKHIDCLAACTYCHPEILGSYRRRTHQPATKTQQISWIERIG
ncbi:peptidoglycan editing factor PgeF [Scandinavium sp.]|uniref:peptidoglycan editing factor PgeF n=1 Tax=Scandinavium sp. TaxID=2830653 RepID=UPI00289FBA2C|nr:peptidoglycan editing factor PgeF [Scandinavium sp.]